MCVHYCTVRLGVSDRLKRPTDCPKGQRGGRPGVPVCSQSSELMSLSISGLSKPSARQATGATVSSAPGTSVVKPSLPAPACLSKYLHRIQTQEAHFLTSAKRIDRRALNERLSNSLFLHGVDAEELQAATDHSEIFSMPVDASSTMDRSQTGSETGSLGVRSADRLQSPASASGCASLKPFGSLNTLSPSASISSSSRVVTGDSGRSPSHKDGKNKSASPTNRKPQAGHGEHHDTIGHELAVKHKLSQPLPHPRRFHGDSRHMEHMNDNHAHHSLHFSSDAAFVETLDGKAIPVSKNTLLHYFGDEARVEFFAQYRRLSKCLTQLAPHGANGQYGRRQLEEKMYSNNNNDEEDGYESSEYDLNDSSTILTNSTSQWPSSALGTSRTNRTTGTAPSTASAAELEWDTSSAQCDSVVTAHTASLQSYFNNNVDARAFIPPRVLQPLIAEASQRSVDRNREMQRALLRGRSLQESESLGDSDLPNSAPTLSASLAALSEDFFADLQSVASHENDKRMKALDREILNRTVQRVRRGENRNAQVLQRERDQHRKRAERNSVRQAVNEKIRSKKQLRIQGKYGKLRAGANVLLDPIDSQSEPPHGVTDGLSRMSQSPLLSLSLQSSSNSLLNQTRNGPVGGSDRVITPRTTYLSACLREGVPPLPHAILRSQLTSTLSLAHCGLGDRMGCLLAEVIHLLPVVEAVNLCDNNLTDVSLSPLLHSILTIDTLKVLDLSRNKIDGESAEALADFLSQPSCTLQRLVLQNADVDDIECDEFIAKLETNKHLEDLDLSSNLLGSAELLSQSDSSIGTGGKALSKWLSHPDCPLRVLRLSWNNIRLASASALCNSIAQNSSLTFLDVNNNGLGNAAGERLGESLSYNRTLHTLLASNNNFSAKAIIAICAGCMENQALKYVELDENPIGTIGTQAIMQSSLQLGSRTVLNARNCNTIVSDSKCWYDPVNVARDYVLTLSNPFERAVALLLLNTVASHSTLIFQSIEYTTREDDADSDFNLKMAESINNKKKKNSEEEEAANGISASSSSLKRPKSQGMSRSRGEKLSLVLGVSQDRELYFDDAQHALLKGLRLLQQASSNRELGKKLFFEADEDGSGQLDKQELQAVLHRIGFAVEEERLNDIMAVFDVDGEGTIEMNEFLLLLKAQQREATMRIKELLEYPILCLPNQTKKYVPPNKGTIYCSVIDGFIQKERFYTLNAVDSQYAYKMAQTIGDDALMTEAVVHNKMRFDEGFSMFKSIHKTVRDKSQVLLKVFPLMRQPHDNRQLLSKVTFDDFVEVSKIKFAVGVALRPLLGLYNGHYSLDLSRELHRVCLSKLLEQSTTYNDSRMRQSIIAVGKVGDLSQHGNWTCFRNEVFNGQKVCVTTKFFTPMPSSGQLMFDFVCGPISESGRQRERDSDRLILSDKKLLKVCRNICLLPTVKRPQLGADPAEDDWEQMRCESEEELARMQQQYFEEKLSAARAVLKDVQRKLRKWRAKAVVKNRDGSLFMPIYEFDKQKAIEVSVAMDEFYDKLEQRADLNREGVRAKRRGARSISAAEAKQANANTDDQSSTGSSVAGPAAPEVRLADERGAPWASSTPSMDAEDDSLADSLGVFSVEDDLQQQGADDDESVLSNDVVDRFGNLKVRRGPDDESDQGSGDEDAHTVDEEHAVDDDEDDEISFRQRALGDPSVLRKRRIREMKRRLSALLESPDCNVHVRAQRFVEVIEESFQSIWLMMRHVCTIVVLFQRLFGENSSRCIVFGSYVVDVVVALFPRIVDLHNFEMLYSCLPARDCAAIFCRIGFLNVFNPLKPEVTYELDVGRREERVVAKMIVYLSVEEPGINLTFKQFQWKRELDPVPGWDVTEPWMTEEGMAAHGKFAFTYYSGEGRNKFGCVPDLPLRKALCQLTLVDENEIIDYDNDSLPEKFVITGAQHFLSNRDVWFNYLLNNTPEKF